MSYAPKQTLEQGFNKFVIRSGDGCWGWKGCMPKNPGYGQFRHGGKLERAHRASWMIHFGKIPAGMFVLHKCDNYECSNPQHLFIGTNLDNIKDMISKDRHPTLAKSGENNHRTKLSREDVMKIKELLNENIHTQTHIARSFGVNQVTISLINRRKTWKELQ